MYFSGKVGASRLKVGGGRTEKGRRTREEGRGKMDEKRASKIRTVRDLEVYRKAFDSAMEIFELSKTFPKEETYSLTDQIRRASRSVCSNSCPVK